VKAGALCETLCHEASLSPFQGSVGVVLVSKHKAAPDDFFVLGTVDQLPCVMLKDGFDFRNYGLQSMFRIVAVHGGPERYFGQIR